MRVEFAVQVDNEGSVFETGISDEHDVRLLLPVDVSSDSEQIPARQAYPNSDSSLKHLMACGTASM